MSPATNCYPVCILQYSLSSWHILSRMDLWEVDCDAKTGFTLSRIETDGRIMWAGHEPFGLLKSHLLVMNKIHENDFFFWATSLTYFYILLPC